VAANTTSINSLNSTIPYLYDSTTAALDPIYHLRQFKYPFHFGSISSFHYIPNNYIYLAGQTDIYVNFRDEFTNANRFRCTIGGSVLTTSAFNLLYYISSDTYLSSLTTNSPICLEIMFSLPNVISFIVNGKIIAQTTVGDDFLTNLPLTWGGGGAHATPNNLGNLIVKNYITY